MSKGDLRFLSGMHSHLRVECFRVVCESGHGHRKVFDMPAVDTNGFQNVLPGSQSQERVAVKGNDPVVVEQSTQS